MQAIRAASSFCAPRCLGGERKSANNAALTPARNFFGSASQLLMRQPLMRQPASSRTQTVSVSAAAAPVTAKRAETYVAPESLHGFVLERQQYVKEYDALMLFYRHEKTGAPVMSVVCDDENKTFGIVLRTPVDDSTGIPHILEHSVLCGSRKYPVKEPFVELMKGSLNTFLNAFTYPDRTCYPVASCNTQDYYNLMDVYLDAVFYPNCVNDEKTFQQEGWHYELDKPEDEMIFKGVVFNEMKGVYSQPDSVNNRVITSALFPDMTYNVDSGGDPTVIPDLTFEKFQEFHAKYYHPTNSRVWFYGDDEPEERLRRLAEYLDEFEMRTDIESSVPAQPLFAEPKEVTSYYAAGEADEEDAGKSFISVNWVMCEDTFDLETDIAMGFLNYLLTGTQAAPLYSALITSGLGEDLVGGGMDGELRQPIYSIGLKGVAPENMEAVEKLVYETLEKQLETGFTESAIEAAINTIEFSLRENNTGRFPRGLSLMLRSMSAWIYDQDPYEPLQWEDALAAFKQRIASGEDVFGPLIKQYILDNKHRVTVKLLPDTQLAAKIEADEKARLDATRAAMGEADIADVVRQTQELKERQESEDDPEALKCIPVLDLSDIPKKVTTTPTDVTTTSAGSTILTHDLFTNDVLYLEAGLPMDTVPQELLPLLPLFTRCLTEMGTETESFVDLTERIGRKTGGLSVYPFTSHKKGSEDPIALLMISGKAMGDKAGDLLSLFSDVLLTAKFDDQAKFKQMVLETRSRLEQGIVGAGHSYAARRLSAQRSVSGAVSEIMGGIEYLNYIRDLAGRVDSEWDAIKADLEKLRTLVLSQSGAIINMTADAKTMEAAQPLVEEFLAKLPIDGAEKAKWSGLLDRQNEAITVPTQVNYVAKAANLYEDAEFDLNGQTYVIEKMLGTSWLWDRVRVVGGAYGGFSSFDSHSGMWTYLSYRDPNLLKTVDAYDGTVDFLRGLDLTADALDKAIIGTIGDIDSYQLPDAKGHQAFVRYLLDISDEERQTRREQVLATKLSDFHAFADVLEATRGSEARVAAVTSADALAAAHESNPGFFEKVTKVL